MHNLNERERLAYINNDMATADLIGRLDDAHRALGDEVAMQAEIDDLRDQVYGLKDELDSLFNDYKNARRDMDEAHDRAKQLHAALTTVETMTTDKALRAFIREVLTC